LFLTSGEIAAQNVDDGYGAANYSHIEPPEDPAVNPYVDVHKSSTGNTSPAGRQALLNAQKGLTFCWAAFLLCISASKQVADYSRISRSH
jgi:hypothetical protein